MASQTLGYGTVYLNLSESGVNTSANTSTISWSLVLADTAGSGYIRNETGNASYSVSGSASASGNFSFYLTAGNSKTIASGSATVSHSSDGSGSAYISASVNTGLSSAGPNYSLSESITLTKIARANSISLASSSLDVGGSQTINISKANSSYTTTLTYSCEGATGTISSQTSNTSVSWTIPDAIEDAMTSKTSATCTITAQTYNGSSAVGSTSSTFTITIPSTYKPTITLGTTTVTNGYNGKLFGGISSFTQNYTASVTPAANSATISTVNVTLSKGTLASASQTQAVTNVMPSSGSNYSVTMTIVATDTRGRTATATKTMTVYAFVSPVINVVALYRSNASGADNPAGQYAYINVSIQTDYAITLKTARVNGTTYTLDSANGTYAKVIGNGTLAINNQYEVVVSVKDQFMTDNNINAVTITAIIPQMSLPLSLYDDKSNFGATVGRIATEPGFNVYLDSTFNEDVSFAGSVDMADRKYKNYSSVTDLSFTAGASATTISAVYSALPVSSTLMCKSTDFPSAQLPNSTSADGIVTITKSESASMGDIEFIGSVEATGDYRMFLNSSGVPTGTWIKKKLGEIDVGTPTTGYASSGNPSLSVTTTAEGIAYIAGWGNTVNGVSFIRINSNGTQVAYSSISSGTGASVIYHFEEGETITFEAGIGINYTTSINCGYFYIE